MENSNEKLLALEKELVEAKLKIASITDTNNNFELLANNMDDFVWIMDKEFVFTYVSPSIKKTLGYTENEFLRKKILNFGTPETQEKIRTAYNDRLNGKSDDSQKQWITQVYHKTGFIVWLDTSTNPILNTKGEFDGVMGVSRNITAKVATERKIQENEANLIAQIENTTDSIWSIDDAYCIKTLNSNFKTFFFAAFGIELYAGISIINALPEPFRTTWKERYDKALGGTHFKITDHFKFEKVPQYVEISFSPISYNNKVIGVSVFSRDITAPKISEKNLIETSANLTSLIEHTDARIWSIDLNFKIIHINNNFRQDFQKTFGVTLEKGSHALNNLPDKLIKQWKKRYDKVLKGEKFSIIDHFEFENGSQFVEVSFNPIRINEEIIGVTCYSRDISSQKIAEFALKESENKFKSLVANIPSVTYQCLVDKNWTMKFMSNEIFNLSGYSPEDFLDNKTLSYASIIHPDDAEYVDLVIKEKIAIHESFTIEYRIIHKNGNICWVHERGRGNYNESEAVKSIDGVISDITLHKISEQELQNSELKFRILSDASMDMMSLESEKEILSYVSEALCKRIPHTIILANTIDEVNNSAELVYIGGLKTTLSKTVIDIIGRNPIGEKFDLVPELNELFQKSKLTRFKKNLSEFIAYQFPKASAKALQKMLDINEIHTIGIKRDKKLYASVHFFSLNSQKLEDSNFIESFINLSGIVLQRQNLMQAIHQSEDKFRSIFENTSSVISIQTSKNILLANKAFSTLTGYSAEEIKTLDPTELIHPLEREIAGNNIKKRLQGKKVPPNYISHFIDKNLNDKWIDISATVTDYEGQKAILVIGNDITERKKSDLELNKFSTGIMNSPSSILITDIDGIIEYVNPFFSEFTGYSFDEMVGQNPNILNSGKNSKEIFEVLWQTILRGEVWNGELLNKKKNGQFYWETARIAPIFDESGIITNFIAIKEDITEQKRTLELIEQSERDLRDINAKKDKFFSIIAHDLRSPFSGLAGLTEILKSSIRELPEEQVDKYLLLISQSTQNILKLLENLLSWAKSQTGKLEFLPTKIELKNLILESLSIVSIAAKNKEIDITMEISEEDSIFADENMLNTIIRNLISNALKYTHKGGTIQIFSRVQKIGTRTFSVIGVKDNGVGIPKDKIEKIFNIEDNYTTNGTEKEKGTGLGLILCQEFAERHSGKIWCESEENVGSTFYISLPFFKNI